MKLDWEARWDSPTGTLVTSGSTNNFTLQPGFHTTKSISFTAPIVTAQRKLYLVMKSYLGSTLVNTEDRIYFNIISGQSLTYNDSITGAGVNQFNYVGSWAYTSQVGAYNADNHYSNTGNDYYTFIFNGNQIVLHSINAPNAGIIAVSIDSGAETNIDLYASSRTDDLVVYTSPTLAGSQHTLKVRVTGTKNVSSSAYYGTADRVDVYSNPTTIINDNITGTGNNQFNYVGSWSYGSQTGAYNMDNHYSNTTNDYYTVGFVGTQIVLHSINAPNAGIIAVSIDSGAETNIDLYASSRTDDFVVYTSPTLASSQHTLKVRVTGTKNVSSSAYYGTADRVDIN
jgi:mannan endo-1,4-beta-mannosidase